MAVINGTILMSTTVLMKCRVGMMAKAEEWHRVIMLTIDGDLGVSNPFRGILADDLSRRISASRIVSAFCWSPPQNAATR